MARVVENLLGGLVTQPDPAMLAPGQLSDIRNLVYRNGANGLCRAYGRQVFGVVSATATAVNGLRDIRFGTGDQYLIAMAGTQYRYAVVGDTGTFSDLATIASGTSLEIVQYQNRFFLMNGATAGVSSIGTNTVVYLSATAAGTAPSIRQHGMLPVVAAPNVTTATGTFSQTVTGYYEYWTTEVAHITADGVDMSLESAFSSDNGVTTVLVSATGVVPRISEPAFRNTISTHWRIYRSPKKVLATDKEFPIGFMIAELASSVTSCADTSTQASASAFPTLVNLSPNVFSDWVSASSITADDGVYASATAGGFNQNAQGAYAFTLPSVKGNIAGIVVEVQAYLQGGAGNPIPIDVNIGRRDSSSGAFVGTAVGKSGVITSTSSAAPTTLTLGGQTDRWGATDAASGLLDTDFTSQTFMVMVRVGSLGTTKMGIDYVKATVYYGTTTASTVVYPTVIYTYGDITSQVSKNFPPPSSNTGDVFQDQLVVNDMSDRSLVRYSFPGLPESFPPTYYIDLETRENDAVQHIRVVNGRLVVGMDTSVWRLNYLPSETDASFDRGDAKAIISRSYGIVNPMCACTFTIDGATYFGQNEQLAFVSDKGICTTDGYNFMVRTKNQNWRNFISVASGVTSYPIALLNNPEERCLRFYYRNDSLGNETYMCLHVSYDSGDIDSKGNFKVSGPTHVRNYDAGGGGYASVESAWALSRSNGNTGIYIGYGGASAAAGGGKVYFETGTAIPANNPEVSWTSRRIYRTGLSGEWMLGDLYGYCGTYTGSPLLTYTFESVKTNDLGAVSRGSKSVTLKGQNLHKVNPRVQGEGIRITMTSSGAGVLEQQLVVIDSSDYGIEDAGT